MALEWFEPDLLHSGDPATCPFWMGDFGPHDLVGDAEHQLDALVMWDGNRINKYVVEFNHLAS